MTTKPLPLEQAKKLNYAYQQLADADIIQLEQIRSKLGVDSSCWKSLRDAKRERDAFLAERHNSFSSKFAHLVPKSESL